MRAVLVCALVLTALSVTSPAAASPDVEGAIVKIYTIRNNPNYFNPWSMHGPSSSTGSGCIIEGRRILTNGHVVSNQTFVQVRKSGEPKRYRARVVSVSHAADLALLTVDDDDFFEGVHPLKIGDLPRPRQDVLVYGFPLGGDTLSVTKGVISRIEHQVYVHSSGRFLAGQIDAAINPGNSGGPVIKDGKVVGVVMQTIPSAENIGYMVPSPVIRHFLRDIDDGRYDGFPGLGVVLEPLENDDLRARYKVDDDETGVLVIRVLDGSPAEGALETGDVIVRIDGHEVANDGTIEFRPKERTSLAYAVQKHQLGDEIEIELLRDGVRKRVVVKLSRPYERDSLVPAEQYDRMPTYYIYGGLVISPLTKNYLRAWGPNWYNAAPKEFVALLGRNIPSRDGEQVVFVVKVLADDVNKGYHDLRNWIIESVNGHRVLNMGDLVRTVEAADGYVEFKGRDGRVVVLDSRKSKEAMGRILRTYHIGSDRSEDLM